MVTCRPVVQCVYVLYSTVLHVRTVQYVLSDSGTKSVSLADPVPGFGLVRVKNCKPRPDRLDCPTGTYTPGRLAETIETQKASLFPDSR